NPAPVESGVSTVCHFERSGRPSPSRKLIGKVSLGTIQNYSPDSRWRLPADPERSPPHLKRRPPHPERRPAHPEKGLPHVKKRPPLPEQRPPRPEQRPPHPEQSPNHLKQRPPLPEERPPHTDGRQSRRDRRQSRRVRRQSRRDRLQPRPDRRHSQARKSCCRIASFTFLLAEKFELALLDACQKRHILPRWTRRRRHAWKRRVGKLDRRKSSLV